MNEENHSINNNKRFRVSTYTRVSTYDQAGIVDSLPATPCQIILKMPSVTEMQAIAEKVNNEIIPQIILNEYRKPRIRTRATGVLFNAPIGLPKIKIDEKSFR